MKNTSTKIAALAMAISASVVAPAALAQDGKAANPCGPKKQSKKSPCGPSNSAAPTAQDGKPATGSSKAAKNPCGPSNPCGPKKKKAD